MVLADYINNIQDYISYGRVATQKPSPMRFHLHDEYEIYFFISGNVDYFIEKEFKTLKNGDLFIMNSKEIHGAVHKGGEISYDRYVIHFLPDFIRLISSKKNNLLKCFEERKKGEKNFIYLKDKQREKFLKIFELLISCEKVKKSYVNMKIFALFIELLIIINNASEHRVEEREQVMISERLIPIIKYIDDNLEKNLSLDFFEKNFFINKYYLCRLFKQNIGRGLHEYIMYKRISKAKELLTMGYSVGNTSKMCGFNDYSNFMKVFKKTTGKTPGRYSKG